MCRFELEEPGAAGNFSLASGPNWARSFSPSTYTSATSAAGYSCSRTIRLESLYV